ncbi:MULTISPECIES: hypothetical protein [unclassified Streptomyces]|uniref:hypothetical protein n=1 Tax=unclassified Streptomyces TaxID=2593676 RepID=UPI0038298042
MRHLIGRRIATAVLAASAVFGGLAMPGTASADEVGSQVRICNNNDRLLTFFLVGYNQYNDWVGSRYWEVPAHACTTAADYWWKTNSSVEFHSVRVPAAWTFRQLYIAKANRGVTQEFTIN